MKAVGIKALKNGLSRYLDLVRAGEVILVTDRDEVIAELRAPSQPVLSRASAWVAFLESQARRGTLSLAKRRRSKLEMPTRRSGHDAQAALAAARDERV